MPPLLLLAYRNVTRHFRRSLFAVLIIAVGIMAILLSTGFIEWNLSFGRESTIRNHLGHIRVVRPNYLEDGLANPFLFLLPNHSDDENFKIIEKQPNVRALSPRLAFTGLISLNDSTLPFIGEGVDVLREKSLNESVMITAGRALTHADDKGIIVGQGLAANMGIVVGDTVVLMSTTHSGGLNAVEVKVLGLFATITKAYDDTALRVPLSIAQKLLRVQGAHYWVMLLDDTNHTDSVLQIMRQKFSGLQIQFIPWIELADFYNKTSALFEKQVGVIKVIIAVIIVLSISNTFMMNVFDRTREIGTAMALGAKHSQILNMFLLEGLLLGLFGGVVGLVFGYFLAQLISLIGIPMPPGPGMANGFTAEIMVTKELALEACAIGLLTALCSSAYPAWRASRIAIVDALRHSR